MSEGRTDVLATTPLGGNDTPTAGGRAGAHRRGDHSEEHVRFAFGRLA